ncbi:unnamed protein product, partial [Oppiella nova]
MTSLLIDITIAIITAIVTCYDIITCPIYLLIQKPWQRLANSRRPKARPLDPRSPYSPWIRVPDPLSPARRHFMSECQTVADLFARVVQKYGPKRGFGSRRVLSADNERQSDGKVFRKLVLSDYEFHTYNEIGGRVERVARGLLALGVRANENVAVYAETRIEWMICIPYRPLRAQALFKINAPIVTLFSTLGNDGVVHGLNETEAEFLITTADLIPKLLPLLPRLPALRHVVYMEGPARPDLSTGAVADRVRFEAFSAVEALGADTEHHREDLEAGPRSDSTAILMYTSGSTGTPKAVQISHANIMSTVRGFCATLGSGL